MSEAKISSRSARDDRGLAVTCPASRHAELIAEELIEHGSCGQLADEGRHAGQSILSAVRSLYAARDEIERLVTDVERHRMTEEERGAARSCAVRLAGLCIGGVVGAYLDRTAPPAAS